MLEEIRNKIKEALDLRKTHEDQVDAILAEAERDGRTELTDDESTKLTEARSATKKVDESLAPLYAREAELVAEAEARKAADEARARYATATPNAPTVRVGEEPRTYRKGGEHRFFADAVAAHKGDYLARERQARHAQEMVVDGVMPGEGRATATSAFGALVVPQYLVDEFAAVRRGGRPFLNTLGQLPMPEDGMTFNIPRGTTGTSVAAQASENAAVSQTDFDETTLPVSVRTFAGDQNISRQAWERGTMVDEIIYADLAADYAFKVNQSAIQGDGTSGAHTGILNAGGSAVTYTDTTPTLAELWPKLADAVQRVNANYFEGPTVVLMHPRRWGWMLSQLDGQNRPLISNEAPQNPMGVGDAAKYGQVVGQVMGIPVVTDAGVPTTLGASTNEDRIIVYSPRPHLFFEEESAPRSFEIQEIGTTTAQLTLKVVVFGYSAFTAGRYPLASSIISGTGLTTPTF